MLTWLRSRCCLTRRLVEIFEEIRVGAQQQPRVAPGHLRLISLHRAVEAEELWILVKGEGIDAVPLGITVTADAFGFPSRVGLDHGDLAVGRGADAARGALAFGTELRGLPLALGLHAPIDRL